MVSCMALMLTNDVPMREFYKFEFFLHILMVFECPLPAALTKMVALKTSSIFAFTAKRCSTSTKLANYFMIPQLKFKQPNSTYGRTNPANLHMSKIALLRGLLMSKYNCTGIKKRGLTL